jgi:hypothetical protein
MEAPMKGAGMMISSLTSGFGGSAAIMDGSVMPIKRLSL